MSHVTTYLAELHSLSLCAGTSIQVVPKRKKNKITHFCDKMSTLSLLNQNYHFQTNFSLSVWLKSVFTTSELVLLVWNSLTTNYFFFN